MYFKHIQHKFIRENAAKGGLHNDLPTVTVEQAATTE